MSVPLVTHVTNNEPSPACENQGSKKLLHVALPRAIHLEIASFLFDPNTWLHGGRALCQTNRQFRQLEPDFIDRRPKTQKHELMNHILRMKHVPGNFDKIPQSLFAQLHFRSWNKQFQSIDLQCVTFRPPKTQKSSNASLIGWFKSFTITNKVESPLATLFASFPEVRYLDLTDADISDDDLEALAKMPHLHTLQIGASDQGFVFKGITNRKWPADSSSRSFGRETATGTRANASQEKVEEALSSHPNLAHLFCNFDFPVQFISKLQKLKILFCNGMIFNNIRSFNEYDSLLSLPNLRHFSNFGVAIFRGSAIETIGKLEHLISLQISIHNAVDIQPLVKLQNLKTLNFASFRVKDADLLVIGSLGKLKNLAIWEPYPHHESLTENGLSIFRSLKNLETFAISIPHAPQFVAQLEGHVQLKHLLVGYLTCKNETQLAKLVQLETLHIAPTQSGRPFAAISFIAICENLRNLRSLSLPILEKDCPLEPLSHLENLESLELHFNSFTQFNELISGLKKLNKLKRVTLITKIQVTEQEKLNTSLPHVQFVCITCQNFSNLAEAVNFHRETQQPSKFDFALDPKQFFERLVAEEDQASTLPSTQ